VSGGVDARDLLSVDLEAVALDPQAQTAGGVLDRRRAGEQRDVRIERDREDAGARRLRVEGGDRVVELGLGADRGGAAAGGAGGLGAERQQHEGARGEGAPGESTD